MKANCSAAGRTRRAILSTLAAALALAGATTHAQQPYPNRTVRMIVPYGVAGTVDIFARTVAQKLTENLGQQFVVDNIPGANGIVGTEVAARAPKDGYTVLMIASNHAINPALYRKISFDIMRDFTGISLVGSVVQVISVHPAVPVRSLKELVAYAKARPGQLNFASTGNGSPTHLYGELLKSQEGIDMVHVPYKTAGAALTSLVAGEVTMSFLVITSALPQSKAGRIRPLAVVGSQRSALAPDLPTITEAGFTGFENGAWIALVAPAGVPREVVLRLNREVRTALDAPDLREKLLPQGVGVGASAPEEVDALTRSTAERWGALIRKLGLTTE
ncbi:MAG: Bug family tripartite tricarboxylate transporter substrate binding protein [Burkholderiales bacterium]